MLSRLIAVLSFSIMFLFLLAAAPATRPAASDEAGITRGKVGQRVESAGLAITVVKVAHQPEAKWKDIVHLDRDQKYVDLELLLENKTGKALPYYPSLMMIKDSEDQEYGHDAITGVGRPLEFGTMPNGQKVRGHLSYTLPRSARGLRFTYTFDGLTGYNPIYIDLGE